MRKLDENLTTEVEDILGMNEEVPGTVWYHGDIPADNWVIGTQRLKSLLNAAKHMPMSVDPTFNHGN